MTMFFKLYTSEGFLIFSSVSLLIFNSIMAYSNKFKYPILNIEIFFQVLTITICCLFLLLNISFISVGDNFFFFNTFETQNLKILLLLIFLSFFLIIWRGFVIQKLNFFEYFIILLITITGLLFLINSYNLISIYLCLEIQALGFYILSSFDRTSLFSSEAGLKYFISSSLISGVFLFSSALIYGSLGTLNLFEILFLTTFFSDYSLNFSFIFLILGTFLILNTLLFKLVIAPYHFWFPQIYDGSPLSSTIIFSTIPKIVLINLFINIWLSFYNILFFFEYFFLIVGLYSVFFGLFKMLKQKRLKKLYIYSSISNFGLVLCVLLENSYDSTISSFFFIIIYLIMSIIFWSIFIIFYYNQLFSIKFKQIQFSIFLTHFTNLYYYNKLFAFTICFLFFSLAALPPFCGFFSKLYLFFVLIQNYKYELSIILIYLGIYGSYYYIKFLKIIFFENKLFLKNTEFKSLYFISFFNTDCTLICFNIFLLFYLFIYPHSLLMLITLL